MAECNGGRTREDLREWLSKHASRHDLAEIIRSHLFHASRPGCSCGEDMFWTQWDLHVADQILAAGWKKPPEPQAEEEMDRD